MRLRREPEYVLLELRAAAGALALPVETVTRLPGVQSLTRTFADGRREHVVRVPVAFLAPDAELPAPR